MLAFRDFLQHLGVGHPLPAAVISVHAQFNCGILYITGAFVSVDTNYHNGSMDRFLK
jgi:hypothetical protein